MREFHEYVADYHDRAKDDRYPRLHAWEHLWDYIQGIPTWKGIANDKNIEKSALHLGFYLANWGMFRGSSKLLNVNINFFQDFTGMLFTKIDQSFWNLELADFTEDNVDAVAEFDNVLSEICKFENDRISWTDTLVTKVLLGVWGQCPARDTYFQKGFKAFLQDRSYENQPHTSGKYLVYLNKIKMAEKWKVPRYETVGDNIYPPGKVIDMAFFELGYTVA